MASYLDFFASAVATRHVVDLAKHCTPRQVEDVLGGGFFDDVDKRKRYFRRDYGLVEFTFIRDVEWSCSNASIQVHRLTQDRDRVVPSALRHRYGPFPDRVSLTDLIANLANNGGRLIETTRDFDNPYRRYTFEPSGAEVFVVGDGFGVDVAWPGIGQIWKISPW